MDVNFELSIRVLSALLIATNTLPVKAAAAMIGAERTSLSASALAVVLGTILTIIVYNAFDSSAEG